MAETAEDIALNDFFDGRQSARRRVVTDITGTPEEASRAIQLGQANGIAPEIIANDLPNYENQTRSNLAIRIMNENSLIADYINDNPLAERVSRDDLGNLDSISGKMAPFLDRLGTAIREGYGEQDYLEWAKREDSLQNRNRPIVEQMQREIGWKPILASAVAIEALFRSFGAVLAGIKETTATALDVASPVTTRIPIIGGAFPANRTEAERAARDITGMVEYLMNYPGHLQGGRFTNAPLRRQIAETAEHVARQSRPYLEAGREPPPRIDPTIDQLKIQQADIELEALRDLTKEVQQSTTRERSPEMFTNFIRQQQPGDIYVPFEAVAKLYGEKLPEVGDGVLGWVPDIWQQWNIALATGGDIRIPMAEWLARVEPQIASQLHENIRVRRDGVTLEEGKLFKEQAKAFEDIDVFHGSPHEFDAFSMERIGTGQGAQSFGHGLYFAENRGVAESYQRDVLAGWKSTGTPTQQPPGNMYRARIKANKEDFLDWDRPYSGQSPQVRERLKTFDEQLGTGEYTGQEAYLGLGRTMGGDGKSTPREAVSTALREAGIPGIRYLDQGSRGGIDDPFVVKDSTGKEVARYQDENVASEHAQRINGTYDIGDSRTYNYVLFDDSLIEILDRNSQAVQAVRKQAGLEPLADLGTDPADTRPGEGRRYAGVYDAFVPEKFTPAEQQVVSAVESLIKQFGLEGKVDVQGVSRLVDTKRDRDVRGLFVSPEVGLSQILYSLSGHDPIGTIRHEVVHLLKDNGFFTDLEWKLLRETAIRENWIEKRRDGSGSSVMDRYKHLEGVEEIAKELTQLRSRRPIGEDIARAEVLEKKLYEAVEKAHPRWLEEAIADEFKWWAAHPENPSLAAKVFEKLREFLEKAKELITSLRSKDLVVEEIFAKIESGEIGRRQGEGREGTVAADEKPTTKAKQLELDVTRQADKKIFETGSAMGVTQSFYNRILKLIQQRNLEDITAQRERAQYLEKKAQTAEWKQESREMVPEVEADLRQRPDIAAVNFFRYGELEGEKLDSRPRINPEHLTPEQIKALPEQWLSDKGMHPDDAASLFGYQTGAEMIARLAEHEQARGQIRPGDFFDRMVTAEVERRMITKYGELDKNILATAEDHVLGVTQMDLLHEQTLLRAAEAGEEFSFTKAEMKAWVANAFNTLKAVDVTAAEWLNLSGRLDAKIKDLLLKDKHVEAFKEQQKQYQSVLMAREAKVFEKEMARFERLSERYSDPVVKGTDQDYTNAIRYLLGSANFPVRNGLAHVRDEMAANGYRSLESFVEASLKDGWTPEVPEVLFTQIKNHRNMDVAEMRDFMIAVESLRYIGRKVDQVIVNGEAMDKAVFTFAVKENLQQLPERPRQQENRFYEWDAQLTRMEEIILDMDLRNTQGPLYQAVMAPMLTAKSKEFDMLTALSKHFNDTKADLGKKWVRSLQDTIPNDFIIDPYTKVPYAMTRETMLNLMLNWGNRSNIEKLSRGYASLELGRLANKEEGAAFANRIKALIDQHATKEDWDFVSAMWQPFKDWQGDLNTLHRNTSGVAPKLIEPQAVQTPFGVIEGGYWPVKYDKMSSKLELSKEVDTDGLFGSSYARPSTASGFLKERTGYVDFVEILNSVEAAAGTMQQSIHYIAFHEAVMQVNKVFSNSEIMGDMRKHYGKEYTDQMIPWLKRVAQRFPNDPSVQGANRMLSRLRLNLIAHTMPFNFKLWLSPDIGVPNPRAWSDFMSNYSENSRIAMEQSKEIKHMVYNFDRDYRMHMEQIQGRDGFSAAYQRKVIELGFAPIMAISQHFRMMTFMDFWRQEKAKGKTDHEAAQVADYHVRERHSAASNVDLPALMNKDEAWKLMTLFAGFQNSMYNWQRQLPGNVRRGEFAQAASTVTGSIFVGALFGMWLYNSSKEGDSWPKVIAKALGTQVLSTIPLVRELVTLFVEGYDSRTPVGSVANALRNVAYDALRMQQGKKTNAPIKNVANVIGLGVGLPLSQAGRTGQWIHDINRGKQQKPRDFIEWQRGIIQGQTRLKQ